MTMRLVLADDHKILREGLRTLLERREDVDVVGDVENGRDAVRLAAKLSPDVVIMDIAMPDLNGMEATRQILADDARVKVLALSMHSDSRFIKEMLRAGACGYVLKDCAFEELTIALAEISRGKIYLSPGVTDRMLREYIDHLDDVPGSVLTAREREVLQLVAEGRTTNQIAELLHVSAKTVETHRKQIMDKLGIRNVAGLTKYAVREGLTALE